MARSSLIARILATSDLCCSVDPTRTTFGWLPGYEGLLSHASRLREGCPSLWIDTGDFAQGGPLAPLTRGRGGFEAAATLPIDVAIAGNHEFDWGISHLQVSREALPFPLLAANTVGLLPGQTVINCGSAGIAVIGLTYPGPELLPNGLLDTTRTVSEVIVSEARAARRSGVEIIVAAIHQGVPFNSWKKGSFPGNDLQMLCQDLARAVDLVIGGHTLTRYLGTIHGVPYLQPFSHGYEIGVCDFSADGPVLRTIRPARGGAWNGCHADLLARAREEVVGYLPVTLRSAPGRDSSLQDWIARCLHHSSGADVALFPGSSLVMQQPPADGALGYLPAGPVTRSDLLRLYPWPDDATVVFEWAGLGLPQLVTALDGPYGGCGIHLAVPRPKTLCIPAYYAPAVEALARGLTRVSTSCGVVEAMVATLARS